MKAIFKYQWLLLILLYSCGRKEDSSVKTEASLPEVLDNGNMITFPHEKSVAFFETETVSTTKLNADIVAPAKVAATIVKSEGAGQNIVLFENPELAGNYTQLIQHLININQIQNINIKQKKIDLDRIKDLQQHGAATGKDLLEAQTALSMEETNLANEKAALIEHETKLKANGFNPEILRGSEAGTAYIICDIAENQVGKVTEGSSCIVQLTAFPNEKFAGKIDNIADMVDPATKMVKLRVSLDNPNGKLKAGMFATVAFGFSEGNTLSVDKNAVVTVQSKTYVFLKTNANTFERKEVNIGNQIGDRIIVYTGIKDGDAIATKGVMQLKGLSFGY